MILFIIFQLQLPLRQLNKQIQAYKYIACNISVKISCICTPRRNYWSYKSDYSMQVCFFQTVYALERDNLSYIYLILVRTILLINVCQTSVFMHLCNISELLRLGQLEIVLEALCVDTLRGNLRALI